MDDKINYLNEHLWLGTLGHGLITLAFVSALLSAVAFAWGVNKDENQKASWRRIGRSAFITHGLSIIGAIGLIFFMMINRYYEYQYAWEHVSDNLPFRYIFSAFWEGQEGSFFLWMFWHVILGFVLLKTAKRFEMPVMATVAFVQFCLSSMVLGLYLGPDDIKIGVSPFVLLRDMHLAPVFNSENYLDVVKGTGLNPLLQNYWMTIHPPTLFLGFASTLIPASFAIAGLWTREHKAWLKPALTWSLFSAAILGTGIFMGGVWAYEALSFGGYWAWDPVENASLVPWIILVAGVHTALIARKTPYAIKSTYVFFLLTFFMIVYSTFLTRSGILGDTSVHAFTEMGLEWQLVMFLALIAGGSLWFFFSRMSSIPSPAKEESAYSREFWMFIGALVLLFSAGLITATTSIPVFNAITGSNVALPDDEVAHHNGFQLWIGVLVALLSGLTQFLAYRKQDLKGLYAKNFYIFNGTTLLMASILGIGTCSLAGVYAWQHKILMVAGYFGVISNALYVIAILRGSAKIAASAVSHIGFGVLMIGVIFSGALKYSLADNFGSKGLDGVLGDLNKQSKKNILVPFEKTIQLDNGYFVRYDSTWQEGNAQYFSLLFEKKNKANEVVERFRTTPNILRKQLPNGQFKFEVANPSTQHFLAQDVFTLAVPNWVFDQEAEKANEAQKDSSDWDAHFVSMGDTFYTSTHYVVFERFEASIPLREDYVFQEGDQPFTALLTVKSIQEDKVWQARPLFVIRGNNVLTLEDQVEDIGLTLRLSRVIPESGEVQFDVKSKDGPDFKKYVVIQALIFPGINLVWLGSIMCMLGLAVGMFQRLQKRQAIQVQKEPIKEEEAV